MVIQDGVVKVKLSYLHPVSASETDFLFGGTPAKRLKAHKRKHGSKPVVIGELAQAYLHRQVNAGLAYISSQRCVASE